MLMCFRKTWKRRQRCWRRNNKNMKKKTRELCEKKIALSIFFLTLPLILFSEDAVAQNDLSDKKENKCTVSSKENVENLEEGEKIVFCSDSLRYIHSLYKIAVILPAYWSKIHINERDSDLGKITSIAFSPADGTFVLFHIIMKKSQLRNIQDVLEDELKEKKSSLEGYRLESEPESIRIKDLETVKYVYSSNVMAKVICYLILNDSFVYELSLACNNVDDCQGYSNDFEKIIKTILVGTGAESSFLQSNKVEFVF